MMNYTNIKKQKKNRPSKKKPKKQTLDICQALQKKREFSSSGSLHMKL